MSLTMYKLSLPRPPRSWEAWMGRAGVSGDGRVFVDSRFIGMDPRAAVALASFDGWELYAEGDGILLDTVVLASLCRSLDDGDAETLAALDVVRERTLAQHESPASPESDPGEGFVYFILNPETRAVKIGHSGDPKARLRSLQTGSSARLVLLGTIAGNRRDEAELHGRFAGWRVHGEWFADCPELRRWIDENAD